MTNGCPAGWQLGAKRKLSGKERMRWRFLAIPDVVASEIGWSPSRAAGCAWRRGLCGALVSAECGSAPIEYPFENVKRAWSITVGYFYISPR